jgi:tetratricopeptide (TPR) repeat protein
VPADTASADSDPEAGPPRNPVPRADILISLALALATLAAYTRVLPFGFVAFDDGKYVYNNIHLREGLTWANLKWVLFSFDPDNWFPLTRLSLLFDYNLFGARAGWYHAENVAIHVLAALLLFGFLRQATHTRWPAAFVAAMFALHPLHVESVAWISERKDVLCAFFWFATLWAWLGYTRSPGPLRYTLALLLFSLGLMSKPMIVTLPFLLFLLDVWPLQRPFSPKRIAEKIPFLALSCAVMAITVVAQGNADTIQSLSALPLSLRLQNALIAMPFYIADTLLPARLWIPHAYPRGFPLWQVIAAAAGILAVSAIALRKLRACPYLAVGWFWFLGTLAPVIGLLQAGPQARADRYMYVPMTGLSIMLAWGAAGVVTRWPRWRKRVSAMAAAACLAMAIATSLQTGYWKDSPTLFRHAIDSDSQNYIAWNALGNSVMEMHPEHAADAVTSYRNAVRLRPELAALHSNLAIALGQSGRLEEGMAELRETIRIDPSLAPAHARLAAALEMTGQRSQALGEYETALRLNPRLVSAHTGLGVLLWKTPGHSAEGLRHLESAVEIDPGYAQAQSFLGQALLQSPDRLEEAVHHLQEALRLDPRLVAAHVGLASVLVRVPGMEAEAIAHLRTALRIEPNPELRKTLDRLEQEHPPLRY